MDQFSTGWQFLFFTTVHVILQDNYCYAKHCPWENVTFTSLMQVLWKERGVFLTPALNAVYTFGNCQRTVPSIGVSHHA